MTADCSVASTPLRAADWRFLLPRSAPRPFEHLVLLGGSSDLAETIVRLNVARHVGRTLSGTGQADAVVMLAAARESLGAVASCLAPDGVLYCEIDRRRLGRAALTPGRLAAQLERHHLHPAAAYWVTPGFPHRSTYIPLDPAVLRWYLASLYRSCTRRRRALRAVLRSVASRDWPIRTLVPCYALTAVRGRAADVPSLVRSVCAEIGWDARHATSMVLAHGEADANRIALLLFDRHDTQPAVVAKCGRSPGFNALVEWEHGALTRIRPRLDCALRQSVPASTLTRCEGLSVAIQTCATGATLRSRVGAARSEVEDDERLVLEWAARFGLATMTEQPPAREWLARHLVDRMFADYEAQYGLTADERRLFSNVAARVDALEMVAVPIVWQHTDLGPWNIFRNDSRVSVIDWEWARHGPALADLLFFVMHWSAEVAGAATRAAQAARFEALFCGHASDPFVQTTRRAIRAYMQRLSIPPSMLPLLLVYTVVERALLHATRFPAGWAGRARGRADNRHIGYLAALARHATHLFSADPARAA